MNYLICLLLPPVIGILVFNKTQDKLTLKREILIYFFNMLLTTIVMTVITVKLWNCSYNIINFLNENPLIGAKYALVAIIVSILVSCLTILIKTMFQMEFNIYEKEVKSIKKNNK